MIDTMKKMSAHFNMVQAFRWYVSLPARNAHRQERFQIETNETFPYWCPQRRRRWECFMPREPS
jgi:hypothetical protein